MGSVKPASDAREYFAGEIYRLVSPVKADFLISPAAVLKLLFVVAQGANETLADQILWDLYIKHVDNNRLREEAQKQGSNVNLGVYMDMAQNQREELNRRIERRTLLEFLKNDFTELDENVTIKNYIASSGKFAFKEQFQKFANEYFKVTLVRKYLPDETMSVDKRFKDCFTRTGLDIFGSVNFKFSFKAPIQMHEDLSFSGIGNFKHNLIDSIADANILIEVVEIPLETNTKKSLTMLIFIPNEFAGLIKGLIGRDYRNFSNVVAKLEQKIVELKLPKLKLEMQNNLTEYFAEHTENGLRDCFNEPVVLNRMFENADEHQFNFGSYWQYTNLEITAQKSDDEGDLRNKSNVDVIFDARKKPYFFVIKSEKVIYVMGQTYKAELEA